MAKAEVIITATDRTQAAIQSAQKGLKGLDNSAMLLSRTLGLVSGAAIGTFLVQTANQALTMADIINKHALETTGGKTYAELDREDPLRATAMNGSFLRASLFTSVVAFGVAAFAMGVGVLSILMGVGIGALDKRTAGAKVDEVAAA